MFTILVIFLAQFSTCEGRDKYLTASEDSVELLDTKDLDKALNYLETERIKSKVSVPACPVLPDTYYNLECA
jgi:hypothetical protein